MLMKHMLPMSVSVSLEQTMVEWHVYLNRRWSLTIKHRYSKEVYAGGRSNAVSLT